MRTPLLFVLVLTAGCAWRPHPLIGDRPAALANRLPVVPINNPPPPPPDSALLGSLAGPNRLSPEVKPLPRIGDWPEQSAIDAPLSDPLPAERDQRPVLRPIPSAPTRLRSILNDVCSDHGHYYSGESLGKLAIGVGAAAALANTSADESLRNFYQDHIGPSQALHAPKIVGEGWYTLPVFAASAIAGSYFDDVPLGHGVGEWGSRSLRTILVGAPPMLAVQYITGASRPGETSAGSHWKPFDDANGVSGHAFMGAVPFISAAKMTEDPFWKGGLYFASALPGLSRINDDAHYTSQVLLSWWMAYLAANAIDETQLVKKNWTIQPILFSNHGVGIGIAYHR